MKDNLAATVAVERMECAYWLLCGIEMIAHSIANESVMQPYSAEETAEIVKAMANAAAAAAAMATEEVQAETAELKKVT